MKPKIRKLNKHSFFPQYKRITTPIPIPHFVPKSKVEKTDDKHSYNILVFSTDTSGMTQKWLYWQERII